jgi:hypothetical protein
VTPTPAPEFLPPLLLLPPLLQVACGCSATLYMVTVDTSLPPLLQVACGCRATLYMVTVDTHTHSKVQQKGFEVAIGRV